MCLSLGFNQFCCVLRVRITLWLVCLIIILYFSHLSQHAAVWWAFWLVSHSLSAVETILWQCLMTIPPHFPSSSSSSFRPSAWPGFMEQTGITDSLSASSVCFLMCINTMYFNTGFWRTWSGCWIGRFLWCTSTCGNTCVRLLCWGSWVPVC